MNILSIDPGKCKFGAAVVNDAGRILCRRIERVRASGDGGRAGVFDLIYAPLAEIISETADAYGIELITLGDSTASREYMSAIVMILRKNERFGRVVLEIVDESHTTEAARALFHKHNPPFFLLRWLPYSMIPVFREVDDFAAVAIALKYLKNKDI